MEKYSKILLAGTFDNFHVGHQFFVWTASSMCEELVIIIGRDSNVRKIKGLKNSEEKRLQRIKEEGISNAKVLLGKNHHDFFEIIEEERPDMLFLGYDQRFDEEEFENRMPNIKIIRANSYFPEIFKSSKF